MNKTTEALKLAEEALCAELESDTCEEFAEAAEKCHKALAAIREALAMTDKTTEAFEAWWSDTGEQSLFALNTTTDDDIKILAGIAWEAAIREVLAESKQAPDGRIPKTVFTIEDIGKAAEMGRQAGMIDALAEPVKQKPVGVFANVNALTPEKGTRWEQMVDSAYDGVKYIHLYAAPVSAKREWVDLTDDEVDKLLDRAWDVRLPLPEFARTVITAFKKKNK